MRARRFALVGLLGLLVSIGCFDGRPEVSPGEGDEELYLLQVGEGDAELVARSQSPQGIHVAWQDDSDSFAFTAGNPDSSEVRIVAPEDYSRPIARAERRGSSLHLVGWSGSDLLFAGEYIDDWVAYFAVRQDGNEIRGVALFPSGYGSPRAVGVLGEGRIIVKDEGSAEVEASVIDLEGVSLRINAPPTNFGALAISPDGSMIAWSHHCGHPGTPDGMFIAYTQTGESRRVAEPCGITDIAWSPDGKEIAFTAWYTTVDTRPEESGGLYVLDLDTLETRRLTDLSPSDDGPSSNFGGEAVDTEVTWLSDGSGLVVTRNFDYGCDHCRSRYPYLVGRNGDEELISETGSVRGVGSPGVLLVDDGLWLVRSDGERELLLSGHKDYSIGFAEFSPDGTWLTIRRHHCGGRCDAIPAPS